MHDLTVADVMHPGIFSADPTTSVADLAATMAGRGIHCVVVESIHRGPNGEQLVWGVITDMDLLAAVHAGRDAPAGRIAATEAMSVAEQLPLEEAVTLMVEHDLSHVIVVDEADGRPTGILSSLDVARAVADGATVQA